MINTKLWPKKIERKTSTTIFAQKGFPLYWKRHIQIRQLTQYSLLYIYPLKHSFIYNN